MIQEKIMKIRKAVHGLNWDPDSAYPIGRSSVQYVSLKKIKRNFAPVFDENNVNFSFDIYDVQEIQDGDHIAKIKIRVEFTLTDAEDGSYHKTFVYGYGPFDEKGVKIAVSYATNIYLSTMFNIVDGMEDSVEDRAATVTEELSKRAIVPTENVPTIEKEPIKVSEPIVNEDKAVKPLSPIERKAADNAYGRIKELYETGNIIEDVFKEAESIYSGNMKSEDVFKLMSIRKSHEPTKKGGF